MDIEDFYKIFADMEDAQEARLKQLKADMIETITAHQERQKKDLVTLSNNTITISRQLDNLSTSKSGADSPDLTKVLNSIRSDLGRIEEARNAFTFKFWCVVVLIVALLGLIEWQVLNQPEKVWQWYVEHNQASQSKEKNAKNR